jgi:hypothetical protein
VAQEAGVGDFWPAGSKEPAIASLLERTLEFRGQLFEKLILSIVRAGMKYRQKSGRPVTGQEIKTLNGLIYELGFKFPEMWDPAFLESLQSDGAARASEAVERELQAERVRASKNVEQSMKLDGLRSLFYDLCRWTDRQAAGLALEKVLNGLFELAGLAPREPFKVTGEQIDGSCELDREIYLVEAKWESRQISEAPLLVFRGKVEGKSSVTRGVFISINGFTEEAKKAITQGKQPNFFMIEGYDLTWVLEGRISLSDLLRGKLRRLAEEGKVFVSVTDLNSAR